MHSPGLYTILEPTAVALGALSSNFNEGDFAYVQATSLYYRYVASLAPAPVGAIVSIIGGYWEPMADFYTAAIAGSFSCTASQAFDGVPIAAYYDTTDFAIGVGLAVDPGTGKQSRLVVNYSGIYSLTMSPQLVLNGGTSEITTFWPTLDGSPIANAASSIELGNNSRRGLPFVEVVLQMNAGQYVEWFFVSSPGVNMSLKAYAAAPPIPAIPSVIAVVKRLGL